MSDDMNENMGTRERLLEAAGEVFSEKGYDKATIRDIVRRAQTNLNAVNYHFRDKEQLYIAVMRYAHTCAHHGAPDITEIAGQLPPEQRLHAFVHMFLKSHFGHDKQSWHMKLMIQEMANPSSAMDILVEEIVRPKAKLLISTVQELAGDNVPIEKVRLCAISVVGQCMHYCLAQPVIMRLNPDIKYKPEDIEKLTNHITRFSLDAIRALSNGKEGSP